MEEEIRQEGQQVLFEEGEACPVYVKIQLEIDELKIEKSKIEAKIGHQIFLRLPQVDRLFVQCRICLTKEARDNPVIDNQKQDHYSSLHLVL